MQYHLRIARARPRSGVDTNSTIFSAPTIEADVAQSMEMVDRFLGDQPGVATLNSAYRGQVWSRRQNMPERPFP